MGIYEKSTTELDQILSQTGTSDLDAYLSENTLKKHETAAEFISAHLNETGQKKKDVIARAGLSEQYGYQLLNGSKKTKDRDKILGLCIAAGLDHKQTERVLKMSGFSPLYSKVDRDAVIQICMNKGIRSVLKVNEELDKRGMEILNLNTT
ncbi:MAG: hypothetical protein IJ108_06510 [Eubacterium sp.]|nr:hypothetical protein [Eubacterium sp.]